MQSIMKATNKVNKLWFAESLLIITYLLLVLGAVSYVQYVVVQNIR